MTTKKAVDEWVARSRAQRAQMKAMAEAGDIEGMKRLIAGLDDWEAYTRKALGLDDA